MDALADPVYVVRSWCSSWPGFAVLADVLTPTEARRIGELLLDLT